MVGVPDTARLDWRAPIKSDIAALNSFVCTTPEKRRFFAGRHYHPAEWELDAQVAIRAKRVPCVLPKIGLIAATGSEIAAAAIFELDEGPDSGLAMGWIFALAIAKSWRGRGLANAMMERVEGRMIERATELGLTEILLGGKIHKRNRASQRCSTVRAGFS